MSGTPAARFLLRCIAALGGRSDTSHDRPPEVPTQPRATPTPNVEEDEGRLGEITLLPHQVEGARRLRAMLGARGGALLADEVGLGKTFTALQVARGAPHVLIVVPATLRPMWQDACRRAMIRAEITSYERLSAGTLPRVQPWALVILDEAHHARSPATRRYDALCELTRGAQVLLLTATPIHNRMGDLSALLALFLGQSAERLDAAALSALIVRRRVGDLDHPLPELRALIRHGVPHSNDVLQALRALPPPLPPADGGVAHALVVLQLTRAWCSSDAALLAAIRNRLATAVALEHALESGRLPTRRDLSSWSAGSDGSVQLAFPELVSGPANSQTSGAALAILRAHAHALRELRALVRGSAGRDATRMDALARILRAPDARRTVVFTHSTVTAEHAFRALVGRFRVALLTGRGARMASGPVPRLEVLRQFAPDDRDNAAAVVRRDAGAVEPGDAIRIDVLIASDVVSEGVDLQRAGAVVHLDLPWTMARIEQRVGRVRRIGSAHPVVASHLIAPPVDAEELQLTLAHLARKATAAGRAIGNSSMLGDPAAWTGALCDLATTSPATVRRAMVGALRELSELASRSAVAPGRSIDRRARGRAPPVVVRWNVLAHVSPRVFALVTVDDVAHVLCATHETVSLDPSAVLDRMNEVLLDARDWARARRCGSRPPVSQHVDDRVRALEASVHRWCSERSAAELLSLPDSRNSASHRRMLHAIDRAAARAPRARRAQLSTIAAEARALVVHHRGAGSERLLESLATSAPAARASVDAALVWLERVRASLQLAERPPAPGDSPGANAGGDSKGVILHGMLTLLAERPR